MLLDAPQGRPERAAGHEADARPVRESEERVAVPVRDQLQRSSELAEAVRRIRTDFDLPMKDDYGRFVRSIIS